MRQVNEGLHAADTIDKLKRAGDDIRRLTQNLLAQGVGAEPLTRTIAALNDALSRRAIDLVAGAHTTSTASTGAGSRWAARAAASRPSPPTRTTRCCSPPPTRRRPRRTRARLLAFARDVNARARRARLSAVHRQRDGGQPGAVPVDGGVEGQVPRAGSARRRRRRCSTRTSSSTSGRCTATRRSATRCANGCSATRRRTRRSCGCMVQNALEVEPPLGLIRAFVVDDEPAVKGTVDLKARGTRLFVDCARVFALAHGIAGHRHRGAAAARRRAAPRRAAARRRDRRGLPLPAAAAAAPAGPAGGARQPEPDRPVRAARHRPADAEGGVPAGEAAAGAAAAVLPAVARAARRAAAALDTMGSPRGRTGRRRAMLHRTMKGQRLVALFLLGVLLFNYPLLALFNRAGAGRSAFRCSTRTSSAAWALADRPARAGGRAFALAGPAGAAARPCCRAG